MHELPFTSPSGKCWTQKSDAKPHNSQGFEQIGHRLFQLSCQLKAF